MAKIVVTNHMTLDGVMQAPAGPDEDRRGGFDRGGWAAPNIDDVLGKFLGVGTNPGGGPLLLGRVTYEHFFDFWPKQTDDNPFTEVLNRSQKYVASTTLSDPLPWENSTLLADDVPGRVAALKEELDNNIVVLGSGNLIQTLMQHDLVDEYVLMIHPLVLGKGARLFPDGCSPADLRLTESVTTTTGVVIGRYETRGSSTART
jgi:dihydrofolate reductase